MENMDYTYNRILTCKKRYSNNLYRLMLHSFYQVVETVSEVEGRERIAHTKLEQYLKVFSRWVSKVLFTEPILKIDQDSRLPPFSDIKHILAR